jgi:GNAT superfamily N-acetyltransferase
MTEKINTQAKVRVGGPSGRETCTIRSPRIDDYKKMADLAGQLGYPSAEEEIRLRIKRMKDDDHAVFVAELETGQILGWVGMYIFRSVETDHCTFISGLIVDETFRSRGIGKVLLKAAEEWARRRGCHTICVSSNVIRSCAHVFYLGNGFRNVKTQITFLKDLDGTEPCAELGCREQGSFEAQIEQLDDLRDR